MINLWTKDMPPITFKAVIYVDQYNLDLSLYTCKRYAWEDLQIEALVQAESVMDKGRWGIPAGLGSPAKPDNNSSRW